MRLKLLQLKFFFKILLEKFLNFWKQNITLPLDKLEALSKIFVDKYYHQIPKTVRLMIMYFFVLRGFLFWYFIVSMLIGIFYSWETTYLMWFTLWVLLKIDQWFKW